MQIKIINDAEGCPSVEVVNPVTGEVANSAELAHSQQCTITLPDVHDSSGIEVGPVLPA